MSVTPNANLAQVDTLDRVHGSEVTSELKVPMYDPSDQVSAASLDELWPEWREGEAWNTGTPEEREASIDRELLVLDLERTRVQRARQAAEANTLSNASVGLEHSIKETRKEVGAHFQAHGIAGKSGSSSGELDALIKGGIDPDRVFYSMNYAYLPEAGVGLGADMPFIEGGLVVVSGMDAALDLGFEYVVVGEEYVRCIDMLNARYPDVQFVAWHDAARVFTDIVNESEGTNYQLNEVDNRGEYSKPRSVEYFGDDDLVDGAVATVVSVEPVDDTDSSIW